ncbi:MAG TPA: hypothetical protein PK229_12115 [Rhodocyclaceae bacterium]|nr:hypothetical protein [Rhodocyclaceae bacterium]
MTGLRRVLARGLRALADWLDVPAVPVTTPDAVSVLARALVQDQQARWPERSGEAKRHQVYAQLIDAFPDTPKRALSRAIEDAL